MNPVFIVGCDRSGTTLMRLMLIQHPTLYIPVETGFLPILRDRAERYGDLTRPEQRRAMIDDLKTTGATSKTIAFDAFRLEEGEAEAALAGAAPTDYAGAARSLYEATAAKRGAARWGDKTPRYTLSVPWLADAFGDAQFVHMIRDGRAVARSMERAGWCEPDRYDRAAEKWKRYIEAARAAGDALGPDRYREVRYEALVGDPEHELRRLCGWLGLDYRPSSMLHYHHGAGQHVAEPHRGLFELIDKPVDASRADAWRRLTDRQAADFEQIAGPLLRELGYDTFTPSPCGEEVSASHG